MNRNRTTTREWAALGALHAQGVAAQDVPAQRRHARSKLAHSVQRAREDRRNSWQEQLTHRPWYLTLSRESMQHAHYWRAYLHVLTAEQHTTGAATHETK